MNNKAIFSGILCGLFSITGMLFGMNPTKLENARVLELGCATGNNLIPIAAQYPKSECVGVDLSKVQIEQGQEIVKDLGLKNIKLYDIMAASQVFGRGIGSKKFKLIIDFKSFKNSFKSCRINSIRPSTA